MHKNNSSWFIASIIGICLFLVPMRTSFAVVDYQLSRPEILPDSPFYKVMVLRDRIVLLLIPTPQKKLEYYLMLADKGIYASELLLDKGKIDLAKTTALKAENYYTLLVTDYKWMFWFAKPIPKELDDRIKIASLKHQEVMRNIIIRLKNEEDKKIFSGVLDFSIRNLQELNSLKKNSQ